MAIIVKKASELGVNLLGVPTGTLISFKSGLGLVVQAQYGPHILFNGLVPRCGERYTLRISDGEWITATASPLPITTKEQDPVSRESKCFDCKNKFDANNEIVCSQGHAELCSSCFKKWEEVSKKYEMPNLCPKCGSSLDKFIYLILNTPIFMHKLHKKSFRMEVLGYDRTLKPLSDERVCKYYSQLRYHFYSSEPVFDKFEDLASHIRKIIHKYPVFDFEDPKLKEAVDLLVRDVRDDYTIMKHKELLKENKAFLIDINWIQSPLREELQRKSETENPEVEAKLIEHTVLDSLFPVKKQDETVSSSCK